MCLSLYVEISVRKTSKKGGSMTNNQIQYWALQENRRSNKARELETTRSNLAREGETYRHNVVSENIDLGNLNEAIRHNQVTERETERSHRANEDLGWANVSIEAQGQREQARHNYSQERETAAHNRETEKQGVSKLALDKFNNMTERTYKDALATAAQLNSLSQAASNDATNREHNARTDQIRQEISYRPQSEARDWVGTIVDAAMKSGAFIVGRRK
nr:putative ORF1 [Marmot picobirnavirus]